MATEKLSEQVNEVSKEKVSLFKRLFRIGVTKANQEVVPTKFVKTKDGMYDTVREKFPPQVQQILKYWTTNCHDDQESFANRKEMYKDLEMIFYNCVAGYERIVTKDYGVVPIKDFVGQEITVLTSKGWQVAKIGHFGKDMVYDVNFTRRGLRKYRTVRATLNHRWRTTEGNFLETKQLKKAKWGRKVAYTPATKVPFISAGRQDIDTTSIDYILGVRHGLIYGDGTAVKHCQRVNGYQIRICTDVEDILPYFDGYQRSYPPSFDGQPVVSMWDGFAKTHSLKELPSDYETDEYLTGFFRGWYAADGSITTDSKITLTCGVDEDAWLRKHMPRIGIMFNGSKKRKIKRVHSAFIKGKEVITRKELVEVNICQATMQEEDFLIQRKKERYGQLKHEMAWTFVDVDMNSGKEEDIYCAIVPGTEDFVLEGGLLTGNSPLLSRAMTLYADEAVQADTNAQIIGVEAEDTVQRDFILDFISNSGIEKYLRSTALNIVQYGDAGWVLSMDENGVESVLPVKPEDIKSRIEFTPHEVQKRIKNSDEYFGKILARNEVLRHLVTTLTDTSEDYATYFKSYLFGFEVGEFVLPPWKFLHFRNFTTKSPFYPFGLPQFIHSIAPYRQYDAAMTLQAIARGAKFPIDLYKLSLTNQMSPTDKLDKALEFIREFDNSGLKDTKKEGLAVGERIITIKDLFEYEQIVPAIDLGDIGDIELLENQLILSTGLPRNMLDPNNGSFGNSGIALIQQYVPFKRQIFHIQSIMLEQITQLVKIHLVQSGKFALKDINFKLSMPYPESQADRDAIGTQSDLITLANTILDSLQAKLLPGGEPLTRDLVTAVYSKVLPFKPDEIEKWVNLTMSSKGGSNPNPEQGPAPEAGAEPAIGGGGGGGSPAESPSEAPPEATGGAETAPEEAPAPEADLNAALDQELGQAAESTQKRKGKIKMLNKVTLEEAVNKEIFNQTQNKSRFREGVMNNRHFYSSKMKSHDFDLNLIIESKKNKMRLDEEKSKNNGRDDEDLLNFGGE